MATNTDAPTADARFIAGSMCFGLCRVFLLQWSSPLWQAAPLLAPSTHPLHALNWRELLHHHTCQRAAMDGAVCFISHSTACDPAPDGAHMSSRDFRSTDTARFNRRPRYDYAACNLSSPTDFLLLKFPWRLTCFFGGQRVSPGSLRDEQAREIKRPCSVTCSCLLCGHSEPL